MLAQAAPAPTSSASRRDGDTLKTKKEVRSLTEQLEMSKDLCEQLNSEKVKLSVTAKTSEKKSRICKKPTPKQ